MLRKLIKSVREKEKKFEYINEVINYIESLAEMKRLSIFIRNTESSMSDIYDLFLELDEDDDFVVSTILMAIVNSKLNAMGFSMIVVEYHEMFPWASAIAKSYILSKTTND